MTVDHITRYDNFMTPEQCAEIEHIAHNSQNWYQVIHQGRFYAWNYRLVTDDNTSKDAPIFRLSDCDDVNWRPDLEPIFKTLYHRVLDIEPRAKRLYRVALNAQGLGDYGPVHIDQKHHTPMRSFVIYCNTRSRR